ncbi:MAG: hypothetical protein IT356_05545 [Gemmatimonadaceae bacterium]|nr:hypothetical protein [Gemmatimonadaceae bacterium]
MNARFGLTVRAVAVACIVAGTAAAQEPRLLAIRDDATRELVRTFVEAARGRGTPTEPLISKALQGVAFKADAKRIEQALVRLDKHLRRSRELLGAQATTDEVAAGAEALGNGVPDGALRDLRRTADRRPAALRRPITVEIGVLTELVAKGVSPGKAGEMVRQLMARGATGTQLTELNAAVQQDVALGVSPAAALELRGKGVMSLLPPPISAAAAQRVP